MSDIRLRDYTARIKELIRDIRLDEAIAHCQQILRHYPKHIETYCLLGEACLEKELYREAIEFFQRTLSADPENLISRVGLGIIYDEQGALPEAIWQMERAFELAPGNAEVRRELQRMYLQQDGAERFRLKLTRGALGRLYSGNGMYERAIDEFHTVLHKDPDLPDVRIALVEALWHEGRRLEAVEACLELLEVLPNCLKANLIVGEIWLRGGNEEAGEEKLQVARALDPENLVAQDLMGDDSPLPLEDVFLPELEVMPEEIGLAGPARMPVPFPGILKEEEAGIAGGGMPLREGEELSEEEEEMPDWLRDLEMEVQEEAPIEPALEEPLMAEVQPGEEGPVDELPAWLQELMGEEAPSPAEEPVALEEGAAGEEPWAEEEAPEWLQEVEEPEEIAAPPAMQAPVEEVPLEGGVPAGVLAAAALLHRAEQEPAEAEAMAEELETEEAEEAEEVPEWVQVMAAEAPVAFEEAVTQPEEEEGKPAEEIPDWLREFEAAEEAEAALSAIAEIGEEEPVPGVAVPASLLALVEAGLLDEADLESAMGEMSAEALEIQRSEEVPSWLQELIGEEAGLVVEEAEPAAEAPLPEDLLAEEEWAVPGAEALVAAALVEEVLEGEPEVLEEEVVEVEEEVPAPVAEVLEEEVVEEVPAPVAEVLEEEVVEVEEVPAPVAEVLEEEVVEVEEVPTPAAEVLEEEVVEVEEVPAPVAEVLGEEVVAPSRVDELVKELKARPRNYESRLELARAYSGEQEWNAALVQYEKLVSARKLLPEVLADLQTLADEEVDRVRLYQLMGDIHMQQNELDQALVMYRRARRSLTRS